MRIEGPTPPSFSEQGKPALALSALQYSVLTSVMGLQNEVMATGAPPPTVSSPSGPVSVAPPTSVTPVAPVTEDLTPAEEGLATIRLACEYLAAKSRGAGDKELGIIKAAFYAQVTAKDFPQGLMGLVVNLLNSKDSSLIDVNVVYPGILQWMLDNHGDIQQTIIDQKNPHRDDDCMAFIMLISSAMGNPKINSDVRGQIEKVWSWSVGAGACLADGMSKFVIAYYFNHPEEDLLNPGKYKDLKTSLDNFSKMATPTPPGDCPVYRQAFFNQFEYRDKLLILSKSPPVWPAEWGMGPKAFIDNEIKLYGEWLNKQM